MELIGGWALVLVPLALGAAIAYLALRRAFAFRQLLENGVDASATVVRKEVSRGSARGGISRRYLRYEYRDALGRLHEHRALVSQVFWDAVTEGGPIPIVYSASRPDVSAPKYLVDLGRAARARKRKAT